MNNSHDLLKDVKGILVKDFIPKYSTIELIESNEKYQFLGLVCLLPFEKVKKDYGDRKIISVMDFNDTHTTSIAIEVLKSKDAK